MPDSLIADLQQLSATQLQPIKYILTDVDDTLTWESSLPVETYLALSELLAAGYIVIPVTGGCAGWSDLMARLWPVSGVITEGGACFLQKQTSGKLDYHYWTSVEHMHTKKLELLQEVNALLPEFTPLQLAQDQAYRLTDVAVDYAQDQNPPSPELRDALLDKLHQRGLQAKASSIHINIWHGDYDKFAMAERVLTQHYGLSHQQIVEQVIYVGDAPNDESMFAKFPLSIGVANIGKHLSSMQHKPNWLTKKPGGHGFAELANKLLQKNG
ncbi:HAD family hydrolase [Marinomonas sp. 2405UD68-3]|uniref:HAD family hydrolase n=1 Tax=Marinomonas sp. 2405UD68-3 TaxID=3391835 RepID=UPI0039C8E505